MPTRNYANAKQTTTLTAGITAAATSMTVGSVTGFPTVFPYVLTISKNDPALAEAVLVTAASGTTLTVTRGFDGTGAFAQGPGALVSHDHVAADYADVRALLDRVQGDTSFAAQSGVAVLGTVAPAATALPSTYPLGLSMNYIATQAGWPVDYGVLITLRQAGYVLQICTRFDGSNRRSADLTVPARGFYIGQGNLAWRSGVIETTNAWYPWRADGDDARIAGLMGLMA